MLIHVQRLGVGLIGVGAAIGLVEVCALLGFWVFPVLWGLVVAYAIGWVFVRPSAPKNP